MLLISGLLPHDHDEAFLSRVVISISKYVHNALFILKMCKPGGPKYFNETHSNI